MKTKQELRRECRARRMALGEAERGSASHRMAGFILSSPEYKNTRTLFAYIDAKNEISTEELLADAWKQGKTVAVPRVNGNSMEFYVIRSREDLEPGGFSFWGSGINGPWNRRSKGWLYSSASYSGRSSSSLVRLQEAFHAMKPPVRPSSRSARIWSPISCTPYSL